MIQTNRSYPPLSTTVINPPPDREMPPARGAKTLGWFMDSELLKGGGGPQQTGVIGSGRRGSTSDESKSTTPSITQQHQYHHQSSPHLQNHHPTHTTSNNTAQNSQKKQKKYRKTLSGHGAARKEGFHAGGHAMSESSEDGCPAVPPTTVVPPNTVPTGSGQGGTNNEEYWFYDVATDGYYYEQNGAKGWRRRQPNAAVHKGNSKDQEVAHMNVNGRSKYDHLLAAQAAAAQAAFLQHAFNIQAAQAAQAMAQPPTPTGGAQGAQAGAPTMRYYDPTSDGFFYEMASVDGWKRRQPNKPVSASLPSGITRPYRQSVDMSTIGLNNGPRGAQGPSYGAALARGQFPRNTVKQQGSTEVLSTTPITTPGPESARDSASSSQCGDTFAELFSSQDPVYNPQIQRPSALNLEQKAVSPQLENAPLNSTAALFEAVLADFNAGGGKSHNYSNLNNILPPPAGMTPSSQSPMKESWNSFRSCSLFSPIKPSKRVLAPSAMGPLNQPMGMVGPNGNTPMIDEMDDDTMKMLMRDLDKLWANTPVSTLNQA